MSSSGGDVARASQPPATGFDASGIFFNQNMSFMTAKSITMNLTILRIDKEPVDPFKNGIL